MSTDDRRVSHPPHDRDGSGPAPGTPPPGQGSHDPYRQPPTYGTPPPAAPYEQQPPAQAPQQAQQPYAPQQPQPYAPQQPQAHAPQQPQAQPYAPQQAQPYPPSPAQPQPYATPYGQQPSSSPQQQPYASPPQQPYAPPRPQHAPPGPYGQQPAAPYGLQPPPGQPYGQQAPAPWTYPGQQPVQPYAGGGGIGGGGFQPLAPPPSSKPSGWNLPAFGMLAIFLVALTALLWPQYRARATEHKINPTVAGMAQRPATARCPRYITSIFTSVGSVSLDENGQVADRTDLTGPICDALRHFYTAEGKAEMSCLVTDGRCSDTALRSAIALNVVAHESMHLRGILDEAAAECTSIGEAQRLGELAGLTAEQGRMLGWIHYTSMNPNTPDQYSVSRESCPAVGELESNPPGSEAARGLLTTVAEETWVTLADG